MRALLLLPFSLVFLASCSSSDTYPYNLGTQCAAAYQPAQGAVTKDFKPVSMKLEDAKMPVGVYNYNGSEVYFKNEQTGLAISIKDAPSPTNSSVYTAQHGCVRNFTFGPTDKVSLSNDLMTTTGFTVNSDHSVTLQSLKKIGFNLGNRNVINPTSSTQDPAVNDTIQSVLANGDKSLNTTLYAVPGSKDKKSQLYQLWASNTGPKQTLEIVIYLSGPLLPTVP